MLPRPPGRGYDLHDWSVGVLEQTYDERAAMRLQVLAAIAYEDMDVVGEKLRDFFCGTYVPHCGDGYPDDKGVGSNGYGRPPAFSNLIDRTRVASPTCRSTHRCSYTWSDIDGISWSYFRFDIVGSITGASYGSNAALALYDHVADVTVVAFRGTSTNAEILSDVTILPSTMPGTDAWVHGGFYASYQRVYSGGESGTKRRHLWGGFDGDMTVRCRDQIGRAHV
jgi:hypothetical protein